MKKIVTLVVIAVLRFALWLRYKVTIKGMENLNPETLRKSGGVLFLPNHPTVFVDPTLVTLAVWKKYPIRPMVVEYMYYAPMINWVMRLMDAVPVPNFVTSSNSLKKKRADKVMESVIDGLKNEQNFLIYPAGKIKHTGRELIGGSGVHRIIQSAPEANVVLVRTTGLWGSSFSRALIGRTPPMFQTILQGVKQVFKNLIFFMPRREITIEFEPAGPDFPYEGSRLEMNQYLEKWYNKEGVGESLSLVSYSRWKEKLPKIEGAQATEVGIDFSKIPADIQQKIKGKLSEMTQMPVEQIQPAMQLASDLGLDSLDNAELLAFLDDHYDVSGIPVSELTSVGKVMALAAKQIVLSEQTEEESKDLSKWNQPRSKERISIPEGETIIEVFLNNCARKGNQVACGDMTAGVLTYSQAKMRVLLLAQYIRNLPGEYIGILLPSSSAAYLVVLACQLAGKVPLMINWTVGSRHLETVNALSKVQVVLSSWIFLDRLENVDLNGIEDLVMTLEDVRRNLSVLDKIRALYHSKKSTKSILNLFGIADMKKDAKAVLLFTSGTESMPKGVPLTHENILVNQRDAVKVVDLHDDDILLGILPPFHAFGFTVSGLLPLLGGIRVAYYPDPTDGKGLAKSVERWLATLICGAPSFLKGMFKSARPGQLKTLHLCVTGAEKAPPELFHMVDQLDHCSLIEGYGITECSPILTINMFGNPQKGVGIPFPSVELCVVDLETHQPVAQGKQGLILAKGPNIFSGYLNPGLSSPFIRVNGFQWYSTGDLGYLDEEGNLILSGRLKRFVKIGAEMVSLAAIEEALQGTIGFAQVGQDQDHGPALAVCAKEEPGERPKIFLFTRFPTSVEEANKFLKEAGFSNLVKIFKVQQLPEIPLMGTGKVNYRALLERQTGIVAQEQKGLSKAIA